MVYRVIFTLVTGFALLSAQRVPRPGGNSGRGGVARERCDCRTNKFAIAGTRCNAAAEHGR